MACKRMNAIFCELKTIQEEFGKLTGEYNIYSSSKIYEIIIANMLEHHILAGAHGADAYDDSKNHYEYKHYKESSSNHTWTFNDYTDKTLSELKSRTVIFAHINDINSTNPLEYVDWYYKVDGKVIARYISNWSQNSGNKRKMINISVSQLESDCNAEKICVNSDNLEGRYSNYIIKIFECIDYLEKFTKTTNLLTSNKLWELFLANGLNHKINSKQGGMGGKHDAQDSQNRKYEYKISQSTLWTFEDVSDDVIANMRLLDGIYLSQIDKRKFEIKKILLLDTNKTMNFIKKKRDIMIAEKNKSNILIRRLNVSISLNEVKNEGLIIKSFPTI